MSKRIVIASVAAVGLLSLATAPSRVQTVQVVNKPGNGSWTVSFSRTETPNTFELEAPALKTKAEAFQVAERLKAWSNSMAANSSLRLAVILIEGEDQQPPRPPLTLQVPLIRDPVPNLDQRINDLWKDTQDTLRKVLEHSRQDIDSARERVKELRDYMVGNVDKLNDDNFKQINGLIDEYNGKVNKYKSEPGGEAFALYPRMNPITRQSMDKVTKWQQAKGNQLQLADGKKKLDAEKARIDQERDALAQLGQSLRDAEARVQSLQQQATDSEGPYTVQIKRDYVIAGVSNHKEGLATYDDAVAYAREARAARYEIWDKSGNLVTSRPQPKGNPDLDNATAELRERQADYQRRLQKYQQELVSAYIERLNAHQSKVQSHADDITALSQ